MAQQDTDRSPVIDKWMGTRWSADAMEGRGWTEYPRPQLIRPDWENLNGLWQYAIVDKDIDQWPGQADGAIRVPYPVQSKLSGVQKQVYEDQALWYKRDFTVPLDWDGQRVILNFGAVDWETTIYVNGKQAGQHIGGYDPFSFDITDYLTSGDNELVVRAWDPTNKGDQPHGKQTFTPNGIWYTAVTGIWQTVWMEPVPAARISEVSTKTTWQGKLEINPRVEGVAESDDAIVKAEVYYLGEKVAEGQGPALEAVFMEIENPKLWSPETPRLYDLELSLVKGDEIVDTVESYFGIREIEVRKDEYGPRIYLNNEPVFMFGPLDQGWWPDGLYTPPTDDALRYDLEVTKRAGFNTVRKHVKVEPATFYRHCDELGLLVWQDMPNNLMYYPGWDRDFRKENDKADGPRPQDSKDRFEMEWAEIIEAVRPFPSVVVLVPFNEAWGQFDTKRVTEWTMERDTTKLVNSASGGNFVNTGHMLDIHEYPGPGTPDRLPDRAIVLGEYGGLGWPVEGHTWQDKDNWGYRSFDNQKDLMDRYEQMVDQLVLLKSGGLSAAIYTQTTDVEIEVNGLLTYDRVIMKMPIDWLRRVNSRVYQPPVELETVLPTADETVTEWQYLIGEAPEGWNQPGFDDSGWMTGKGGFGTAMTPGSHIGTTWDSALIHIRKRFEVDDPFGELFLKVHHDEDISVTINGKEMFKAEGYLSNYNYFRIPDGVLKKGTNVIAVSCKQTQGGQYVDAGIYRVK